MSWGVELFRDDGSLFTSPDVSPLNLVQKLYVGADAAVQTNVPIDRACMVFIRNDNAYEGARITRFNSNGYWAIQTLGCIGNNWLYIFSNYVPNPSGWGVQTYDAYGTPLWNTGLRPLQIIRHGNPFGLSQQSNAVIDVGYPVAVVPGMVSTWVAPLNPAQGLYLVGNMTVGAVGNSITAKAVTGSQVSGGFPRNLYKNVFICINTNMY